MFELYDLRNNFIYYHDFYITAKEKSILDQEGVKIFVSSLADSAVMMGIRCWVSTEEYVGAKWRLNEDIKLSFDREGIEIPYQKLDVCIKSDETEQNPEIKG